MIVYYPIKLVSVANLRESEFARARRAKKHKSEAFLRVWNELPAALRRHAHEVGVVVTVTRIGPRALDKHDNLPASCKATVDGIAAALGLDDADERVEWRYDQRKGKPRHKVGKVTVPAEHAVEIRIDARETIAA